jgi:cell division transport system ATP-binding protein
MPPTQNGHNRHPPRIATSLTLGNAARAGKGGREGQVIAFENVAYSYGGGELLSEISLRLAPGSFHFLTGPSGAGKSTLLKLAYAELLPTAGRVTIFDREVRGLSRDDVALTRRRIGVVHQDVQFLDHLPLAANVALPLMVSGKTGDPRDLTDLLQWVGLGQLADALPPQLSGGERQRAALARAVITGPDVILADEPTGNIDWEMSLRLLTLLVELNRMGKTILVATHDMNLIRSAKNQVAARVLRIRNRRVQLAGADL